MVCVYVCYAWMVCVDGMHKRVGAMRKCDVCYMVCYVMYATQISVRWYLCAMRDGQAGWTEDKSGSNGSKGKYWQKSRQRDEKWR